MKYQARLAKNRATVSTVNKTKNKGRAIVKKFNRVKKAAN